MSHDRSGDRFSKDSEARPLFGLPVNGVISAWQDLLSAQVSCVRDFWSMVGKAVVEPRGAPRGAKDFWVKWCVPNGWLATRGQPAGMPEPPTAYFVIDSASEATPEKELLLQPGVQPDGKVIASSLRNVTGVGEIPASNIDVRVTGEPGKRRVRISLVDLGGIHRQLDSGAIEAGLYVGGVSPDHHGGSIVAIVQAAVR
jgi:hypothetical protein